MVNETDKCISTLFVRDNGEEFRVFSGISDQGHFGAWTEYSFNSIISNSPFTGRESIRFANLMAFMWLHYAQTMEECLLEVSK